MSKLIKMIVVVATLFAAGCGDQSQKAAVSYHDGFDAFEQGNFPTAMQQLDPIAKQGDAKAQFYLGLILSQGKGVAQDFKQAANWLNKAAEQHQVEAQENLGLLYAKGQGVERDWVQADKWFGIAAALGKETAANNKKIVEMHMAPEKIAEANKLTQQWLDAHKR
ncbi:MAG: tetratricopeptide repeat protein [Gallionella sp.]